MTTTADPRAVADTVTDPELPLLTLSDLGVLRDVHVGPTGTVVVELTPTYPGCPAMGTMRADLVRALAEAGFADVEVRTVPEPAWRTDWITADGRRKLVQAGIAPPAPGRPAGPVALEEPVAVPQAVSCPLCGSADTEALSEVGSTACKALRRCRGCAELFEHLKEV
ncbi:1,2-phenylacetyl-CoA epoxidase subunit PaaD [Geodermatophilus sp. CPCC 206100]|uniref:1,2-phenylacetyl-CoA epoxidase subunit PaaD n=1 Tax=Geodermatophilus sp. CPCC 206100 TaxID=3020054 RepID=UPI003B00A3C3